MADYPQINVPVSEDMAKRIEATDRSWSAPKLVILLLVTMTIVVSVLLMAAEEVIGPAIHQ